MRKFLLVLLLLLTIVVCLLRFGDQFTQGILGLKPRAGLRITTLPASLVYLDGMEVGQTPYQDEKLEARVYQIRLLGDQASWEGAVRLNEGTLSIINRELAATTASSSGEILTLSPGQGVVITSSPNQAEVEIDGQMQGLTPLSLADLTPGEHTFILSHQGYLKRSIRAALPEKMALRLDFDLAVTEINLAENFLPTGIPAVNQVVVKQTQVGFLRVREKPSSSSKELARVKTGDSLILLEEINNWMKVRLENGLEGYVSAQYVQKQG